MNGHAHNGLNWSQTAEISYRSLANSERANIDHILSSLRAEQMFEESYRLNEDLFVFRVPPFYRLVLKREGEKIQLVDILDKRVVDAFWGRAN